MPPEMHDCRQWTAVYVRSLAARMTMTRVKDKSESSELWTAVYVRSLAARMTMTRVKDKSESSELFFAVSCTAVLFRARKQFRHHFG